MIHKMRIVLLVILCSTQVLFGCTNEKVKELNFRITWTDYSGRGVAIQKVVDAYNKDNKKYKIILQSGNEDFAAVEELLIDDTHSTIYALPYRYVSYFGEVDLLDSLDNLFSNEKDNFYPELWNLGLSEGTPHGIPWLSHSICLIYNKNLLDQAGVDPASITSLSTFVEALQAVEDKTQARGLGLVGANHNDVSWMVNQFIYGFGSSLVDESGTIVTVNNSKSVEAIRFYRDVLGSHAQPTWVNDTGVEVMNYFRDQAIAFEFQGIWGITDIEKNGSVFETGIINLETLGLSPEVGPLFLAIEPQMNPSDHDEAIRFIKYMISTSAQEMIMKGEYSPEHDQYYPFRVPARKDLANALVFMENPQYLPFIAGFTHPSIDVPTALWQNVKTDYYAPGLHEIMLGSLSIEDFLQNIESEGNRLLKP